MISKSNSQVELTGHRVFRKVEFTDRNTSELPIDSRDQEQKKLNHSLTSNYNPINLKMNLVIQDSSYSKQESDSRQAQPLSKEEAAFVSVKSGATRTHARHSSALGQITQYLQKKIEGKITPVKREKEQVEIKRPSLVKKTKPVATQYLGIHNALRRASDHKLRVKTPKELNQTDSKSRLYHNIEIQEMSLDDEET